MAVWPVSNDARSVRVGVLIKNVVARRNISVSPSVVDSSRGTASLSA
jgi:hypothetical protein